MIQTKQNITIEQALHLGDALGVDWNSVDINQFRRGIEVELEHGIVNSNTNVTNDDLLTTGKIALAHLNELSDYYTRLDMIENANINVITKQNTINTPNNSFNLIAGSLVGIAGVLLFKKFIKK